MNTDDKNLISSADVLKHWKQINGQLPNSRFSRPTSDGLIPVYVVRTCYGYRIRFRVRNGSLSKFAGHFTADVLPDVFAKAMESAARELDDMAMRAAA